MSRDNDGFLNGMACLGIIALFPLFIVAGMLVEAWALVKLWGWFMVPTFGLPALTYLTAIGLSCVANVLHPPPASEPEKPGESTGARFIALSSKVFLRPALLVAIGWVALRSLG